MNNTIQINHISKLPYRGGNQYTLGIAGLDFQSSEWLTFVQANMAGLKIKKGSKAIRLWAVTDEEHAKEGSKNTIERTIKHFNVFNLDQTERQSNEK